MKSTRTFFSPARLIACMTVLVFLSGTAPARAQAGNAPPPPKDPHREPETNESRVAALKARSEELFVAGMAAEALVCEKEIETLLAVLYAKDRHPKGHVEIAWNQYRVAMLYGRLGENATSIRHFESSIAMLREFPDEKKLRADFLGKLAAALRNGGDLAKAETCLLEADQLYRAHYPAEKFPQGNLDLASIDHQLGELFHIQGRLEASVPRYESTLRMCRAFCESHPDPSVDIETDTVYRLRARVLMDLADIKMYFGDLGTATTLLHERVNVQRQLYGQKKFPHGHYLIARSLQLLGAAYLRQSRYREAEVNLEEALAMLESLSKQGDNRELQFVQTLCDLARLNESLGRLDVALEQSHSAVERMQRVRQGQPSMTHQQFLGFTLRVHASVLSEAGNLEQGRVTAEQCVSLLREVASNTKGLDDFRKLAIGLYELAKISQLQGEFQKSKNHFVESLEIYRQLFPTEKYPQGHPELAGILSTIGSVCLDLSDSQGAMEYLLQADQMWTTLDEVDQSRVDQRAWAVALDQLGVAQMVSGNYEEARRAFLRSHEKFQEVYPSKNWPTGNYDLAHSLVRQSRLHRLSNESEQAVRNSAQALEMARSNYPPAMVANGHRFLVHVLETHAAALFSNRDYATSAATALLAAQMNQRLADQVLPGLSEAECLNYVATRLDLPPPLIPAWQNANRPVGDLYDLVWKQRAIVLRMIEARQLQARRSPIPEVTSILEEQQRIARRLATVLHSTISATAQARSTNQELSRLIDRKEELERELARRVPRYLTITDRFELAPKDLLQNLPAGAAYVEFLAYSSLQPADTTESARYAAFIVQPNHPIHFRDLGDYQHIQPLVTQFRQEILANQQSSKSGAELRKFVWEPLEECFADNVQSVYLCPDAGLTAIPWAALPGRKHGSVLLHDHAIALVPCGQYLCNWLRKEKPPSGTFPDSLLAVGDVDYNAPADSAAPAVATPSPDIAAGRQTGLPPSLAVRGDEPFAFGPLAGTRDELDNVTRIVGEARVKVLRGTHASTSNVLDQLPRASRAHFATHGFFAGAQFRSALQDSPASPGRAAESTSPPATSPARNPLLLSGLVLAGANIPRSPDDAQSPPRDDGILTAESISQLPLENLDLAILSACETGLGDVAGGEGVLGLQRAFHMAGTRNVIASLWKIDDRATAVLMQLVYHKMIQERKSIAQSLREAQLALYEYPELLEQAGALRGRIDFSKTIPLAENENRPRPDRLASPRLWASFILSGPGD